jgi:VanZ family protein
MRFSPPLRLWIPAVVWAGLIFAISAMPGQALPPLPGLHSDKLVHGAVYAVLGGLLWRALARTTTFNRLPLVAVTVALATLYGASDELHQLFVPGRMCDVADAVADAVGALTGSLVAAFVSARGYRHRDRRER